MKKQINKLNYWSVDLNEIVLNTLAPIAEDLIISIWEDMMDNPCSSDLIAYKDFYHNDYCDWSEVEELLLSNKDLMSYLTLGLGKTYGDGRDLAKKLLHKYCEDLDETIIRQYKREYRKWYESCGLIDEE